MDSKKCDQAEVDPELEYLKAKAQGSMSDIINNILENEKVKEAINKAMLKQSLKYGFLLSSIILGAMSLLSYVKTVYSAGWIDLPTGAALLLLGIGYIIKELRRQ